MSGLTSSIDGLHVIERMKEVLRGLSADIRNDPDSRNVMLAERGFTVEDINRHSYAAAAAISVERPEQALTELAALAAKNARNGPDAYGLKGGGGGGGGASVTATEADEFDRLAAALESQIAAMNKRTAEVAERTAGLAKALRERGHQLREQHTARFSEAQELEDVVAGLEKKYSQTVTTREPSKG